MVEKVNSNNLKGIIAENHILVLKIWAEWCAPCKAIAPAYEALSEEMCGNPVMFAEASIEESPEISDEFGVRSIPAFLIFVDGELKERIIGSSTKLDIKAKIEQYL